MSTHGKQDSRLSGEQGSALKKAISNPKIATLINKKRREAEYDARAIENWARKGFSSW